MVNFGPMFNKNIALQFPQQSGGIQFHLVYTFMGGGEAISKKLQWMGGVVGMKIYLLISQNGRPPRPPPQR